MPGKVRAIRPPTPSVRTGTTIASLMAWSSPGDVRREVQLHEHGHAQRGDDGPPVDPDSFRWHLRLLTAKGCGTTAGRESAGRRATRHGPLRVSSRTMIRERRRWAYARSRPEGPTQQHAQAIIRDMLILVAASRP